jgi:hypothetical protein
MADERCDNCRYWRRREVQPRWNPPGLECDPDGVEGTCRAHPPRFASAVFELTLLDDRAEHEADPGNEYAFDVGRAVWGPEGAVLSQFWVQPSTEGGGWCGEWEAADPPAG